MPEGEALPAARERFRGLPLSDMRKADIMPTPSDPLEASEASERLRGATREYRLGEVDVFLSHSWHDDGHEKWAALRRWADEWRRDHGYLPTSDRPVIWFDKARLRTPPAAPRCAASAAPPSPVGRPASIRRTSSATSCACPSSWRAASSWSC